MIPDHHPGQAFSEKWSPRFGIMLYSWRVVITSGANGSEEVCAMTCGRLWLVLAVALVGVPGAVQAEVQFRHALDDSPLAVKPQPGEVETDAVKTFKQSGENPYLGNEQALAEGKKLYVQNCQACHLPDGSGRMGPSLISDKWIRERAATDVGMFEIIYGGASGAMQSFARRGLTQDQILRVIAYVRSLKKS
jgi:cytochrome c-L